MSRIGRTSVAAALVATVVVGSLALKSPTARAAADERARAKFEVYKDRGGEFRWRLRAQNTQVLATSGDGYKAKRDCLSGIESVKRAVAEAQVEDLSEAGAGGGEGAAGQRPAEPPQTGRRGNR